MLLRSAPPGCMCAIQHKLLPTAYAPAFGYRFRHCYSYMRLLAHLPSSLLDTRCYPTFPGACCLYLVRCAPEDCHPGCVTNIVTATDKCPSILLPLLNPSLYLTDAFAEPCLHSTHEPHDATTASVSADWFPPSQTLKPVYAHRNANLDVRGSTLDTCCVVTRTASAHRPVGHVYQIRMHVHIPFCLKHRWVAFCCLFHLLQLPTLTTWTRITSPLMGGTDVATFYYGAGTHSSTTQHTKLATCRHPCTASYPWASAVPPTIINYHMLSPTHPG